MLPLRFREVVSECAFGSKEVPPLERDSSYVTCCHPRRIGQKHVVLCGNINSNWPMKWMVGPDFPAVLLVFALILVIGLPSITLSGIVIGWYVALPMVVVYMILLIAYSATACSDPGIIYGNVDGKPSMIGDNRVLPSNTNANATATSISSGISDIEMATAVANTIENITSNASTTYTNSSVSATDTTSAATSTDDVAVIDIESSSSSQAQARSHAPTPNPTSSSSSSVDTSSSSLRQYNNNNAPSTIECSSCEIQRPFTASHCAYCGVCIDKLDHHCPWSGQCIGRKNMIPFQVFVSLIGVMCWFCIGAVVYSMYLLARYH